MVTYMLNRIERVSGVESCYDDLMIMIWTEGKGLVKSGDVCGENATAGTITFTIKQIER